MNFNKYFPLIICLSQRERLDRRFLFDEDRSFNCEFFFAVDDEDRKRSFNISQMQMLQRIQCEGHDVALCLEDDATFKNAELLDTVMSEVPEDWEIIYFGANVKPHPDFKPPKRISKHIFRIYDAYTTHCIAYKKTAIDYIIQRYDGGQMYDSFLSDNVLKNLKAYICHPFLSMQRPTRSDLWDRNVDYTDTFKASEHFLSYL